eukprot:1597805-Pyramimonas_sp.AAC.1
MALGVLHGRPLLIRNAVSLHLKLLLQGPALSRRRRGGPGSVQMTSAASHCRGAVPHGSAVFSGSPRSSRAPP